MRKLFSTECVKVNGQNLAQRTKWNRNYFALAVQFTRKFSPRRAKFVLAFTAQLNFSLSLKENEPYGLISLANSGTGTGTGVVSFTNPPVLTWHLPTYNILSGYPPLTLGAEVQLCWLLPLTLEPSA